MSKKSAPGRSLKGYEGTNLLFFLVFVLALGIFVSFVFRMYRGSGVKHSDEADRTGIVSEVVSPTADLCLFYLQSKVSESSRAYRSRAEIPVTDDGLVKGLFAISGVTEVLVDQRLITLRKSPSARWEAIQPSAREIISTHTHLHQ